MTILYKCDACGEVEHQGQLVPIHLTGYRPKGGILLPDTAGNYHFLSRECFINWVNKNVKESL